MAAAHWGRHRGAVNANSRIAMLHPSLSPQAEPAISGMRPSDSVPLARNSGDGSGPPYPTSQHLYIAFVDRINYSALYALEKMLECHTEPCLAVQSQIVQALNELRGRHRALEI